MHPASKVEQGSVQPLPSPQGPIPSNQELSEIYQFPENGGRGQTIAILEWEQSMQASDKKFDQLRETEQLVIHCLQTTTHMAPTQLSGIGSQTIRLLQSCLPDATLHVYISRSDSPSVAYACQRAILDGCDILLSPSPPSALEPWPQAAQSIIDMALQQASEAGITTFVGSRDIVPSNSHQCQYLCHSRYSLVMPMSLVPFGVISIARLNSERGYNIGDISQLPLMSSASTSNNSAIDLLTELPKCAQLLSLINNHGHYIN